jgi:hypothetical protein
MASNATAISGESALHRAVTQLEDLGYVCFAVHHGNTAVVLARKDSFKFYAGRANDADEIASEVQSAPDLDAHSAAWHIGCAIVATLL